MTEGDALDVARSLRYQADQLRKEAAKLDSISSYLMKRYGNPADEAKTTA